MLVFITWSGDRSKALAETFSKWIVQVIQAVEPWISTEIEKGTRWNEEVATKLEESRVGIICLTKENPNERWILFESGAIAKTKNARVCTLLLDIDPSDIPQPLGGFQHTTARDKSHVRKLLRTLNTAVAMCGEKALSDSVLDRVFDINWPELLVELDTIASQQPPSRAGKREVREIVEEILEIVRSQERRLDQAQKNQLREFLIEKTPQENLYRISDLYKTSLLSGQVGKQLAEKWLEDEKKNLLARYLAERSPEAISEINEFAKYAAERRAEDEKKAKGSSGQGGKHDTYLATQRSEP